MDGGELTSFFSKEELFFVDLRMHVNRSFVMNRQTTR